MVRPQISGRGLRAGGVGHHEVMARDRSDDFPLTPEEALDSDEVRNDDGDEVVEPPERWIEARDDETLDERLGDEEPDVRPGDIDPRDADDAMRETKSMSDGELDELDPQDHGRTRGQIDGTPEDGDSFYDVEE
jgi:hypothetical protein